MPVCSLLASADDGLFILITIGFLIVCVELIVDWNE